MSRGRRRARAHLADADGANAHAAIRRGTAARPRGGAARTVVDRSAAGCAASCGRGGPERQGEGGGHVCDPAALRGGRRPHVRDDRPQGRRRAGPGAQGPARLPLLLRLRERGRRRRVGDRVRRPRTGRSGRRAGARVGAGQPARSGPRPSRSVRWPVRGRRGRARAERGPASAPLRRGPGVRRPRPGGGDRRGRAAARAAHHRGLAGVPGRLRLWGRAGPVAGRHRDAVRHPDGRAAIARAIGAGVPRGGGRSSSPRPTRPRAGRSRARRDHARDRRRAAGTGCGPARSPWPPTLSGGGRGRRRGRARARSASGSPGRPPRPA
jgi:hypothetical protein